MKHAGVYNFIFSGSSTVYGPPMSLPLTEEHQTGVDLTNPYGRSKAMIERVMQDIAYCEKVRLLFYVKHTHTHILFRNGVYCRCAISILSLRMNRVRLVKIQMEFH
jgi:hypothetical protein